MQPFEYTGYWWTPDDPEKVPGSLRFTPESGLRLELLGYLGDDEFPDDSDGIVEFPVVWGVVKEGKVVTLTGCWANSHSFTSPGLSTHTYISPLALVGAHLEADQLELSRLYVQFPYLPDWLGDTGLTVEVEGARTGGIDRINIEYQTPLDSVASTTMGEVATTFGFSTRGDSIRSSEVRTHASVRFEPGDPMSIDRFMRVFIQPFSQFLALATDRPNLQPSCTPTLSMRSTPRRALYQASRSPLMCISPPADQLGPKRTASFSMPSCCSADQTSGIDSPTSFRTG